MPLEPHRYRLPSHHNTSQDVGLIWRLNQALARDPRTAGYRIEITAVEGRVRLQGTVPSPEAREAVVALVRQQPGVASVVDELRVHPPAHH
jgi:hyperosmotically inducible protein